MEFSKSSNAELIASRSHSSRRVRLRAKLDCDFGRVRVAAKEVQNFLKAHGCEEEARSDCELALVEACNNAIKHAGPAAPQKPVILEVFIGQNEIEMRITDHGPGFAWPGTIRLPKPENESGRGLYLIRILMDSAAYIRGTGQNTMVLKKRRSPP